MQAAWYGGDVAAIRGACTCPLWMASIMEWDENELKCNFKFPKIGNLFEMQWIAYAYLLDFSLKNCVCYEYF